MASIKAADNLRSALWSRRSSQILFQFVGQLRVAFGALVSSQSFDSRAEKLLIALCACTDKIDEEIGPGHDHIYECGFLRVYRSALDPTPPSRGINALNRESPSPRAAR